MPSSHNAVSFRSYFCDWVLCPWHECSTRNKSSLYPTIHQKKCRHISWIIFSLSTWGCFVAQNGDVMYLYNKKIWAWRVGLSQSTNHGILKNWKRISLDAIVLFVSNFFRYFFISLSTKTTYLIYKKSRAAPVRAHFYVKLPHDFSDMIPTHGEWFFGDQKLCQIVAVVQKKVKIESSNGFLWHVRDSVDENYFFFKSYDYVSLLLGKEDGLELPITLLTIVLYPGIPPLLFKRLLF